ncbi:aspartyl protease family protein [Hymenobacter yonginensis]|uniref:Aspartyl protease family protein n=1 Tax=Hymenobacter yonginensis TaxID=748197 RepID=A0ABY7PH34_9BACT|nr:aspartyl protease family protein [Hymenobacter yonginensis]WBO82803.1 aspartyl protease family protein [Hymenobacter yonginensis]
MPARWFCFLLLLLRVAPAGVCLLLLLGAASGAVAQSSDLPFRLEKPGKQQVRLPFYFQRNLIIVEVKLNGAGPYNFLLDTGVATSIITDPSLTPLLRLRPGAEVYRVAGVGEEEPLEAHYADSIRVTLPGIVAPALPFLVLSADVLNLSGYVGMPIHGILGYDIFRSFVIEIEPNATQLVLHAPAGYQPRRGRRWTRVPLTLERRKPYLTVPVGLTDSLTLPLKLVLDTGAGHALSIETTSDPRLRVPEQRLRSQLGRGLSGAINGYLGRVRSLQLGRYQLQTLLTSFPEANSAALRTDVPRNGNIGFELLKRFDLVIDYSRREVWLRPNALYHDPFEHDMCGLELLATGQQYRNYIVMQIEDGSPAAMAGIQPKDELLSVNLQPAAAISLTELSRIFHSGNGRMLLLVLRRPDGELYTTQVRLQRKI